MIRDSEHSATCSEVLSATAPRVYLGPARGTLLGTAAPAHSGGRVATCRALTSEHEHWRSRNDIATGGRGGEMKRAIISPSLLMFRRKPGLTGSQPHKTSGGKGLLLREAGSTVYNSAPSGPSNTASPRLVVGGLLSQALTIKAVQCQTDTNERRS